MTSPLDRTRAPRPGTPRLGALLAAVALAATAAACSDERALSTAPVGDPSYGFALTTTGTNIPRGSATFVFPRDAADSVSDTVRVTLAGLDTLENGVYVVWIGDALGTTFKKATGTLVVTRTDTVLNALGDPSPRDSVFTFNAVSAFSNGGPRNTARFTTTRAASGLAPADLIQSILVTVEKDGNVTAPTTKAPLWALRSEGSAPPDSGKAFRTSPVRFGNFDSDPTKRYTFVPQGRGRVGVRGEVLIVDDSSLSRPPQGYFYAVYAIRRDTANVAIDTLYLGPQTSPYPNRSTSLYRADSTIVDPAVQTETPQAILAAATRISADTVGTQMGLKTALSGDKPYLQFANIYVTLESKSKKASRMGTAIILQSDVPGIVRNGVKQ